MPEISGTRGPVAELDRPDSAAPARPAVPELSATGRFHSSSGLATLWHCGSTVDVAGFPPIVFVPLPAGRGRAARWPGHSDKHCSPVPAPRPWSAPAGHTRPGHDAATTSPACVAARTTPGGVRAIAPATAWTDQPCPGCRAGRSAQVPLQDCGVRGSEPGSRHRRLVAGHRYVNTGGPVATDLRQSEADP